MNGVDRKYGLLSSDTASVQSLISHAWQKHMYPVDQMIEREGSYLDNLRRSPAVNEPITLRKRDDNSVEVWDGHHRLAARHLSGRQFINYRWDS